MGRRGSRGTIFSERERRLLLYFVAEHKNVLENRRIDFETSKMKRNAWVSIANKFNSECEGEPRNVKQLKGLHKNLKNRLSKNYFDRYSMFKTNAVVETPVICKTEVEEIEIDEDHNDLDVKPMLCDSLNNDTNYCHDNFNELQETPIAISADLPSVEVFPFTSLSAFNNASQEAESSVSESNSSIVSHDAPYTTTKSNTNCQNVRNRRRKVLRHKERMKISYVKSKLELLSLEKRYMKTLIKKADLELQLLERQLSKNC